MIAYQLKIAGEWCEPLPAATESDAAQRCLEARQRPDVEAVAILSRKSADKPWAGVYNGWRKFKGRPD